VRKPKSRKKKPVVFLFQLADYQPVRADRLKEWERSLIERVGMNRKVAASMADLLSASTITGTFSRTSPKNAQYDDCDTD
jgi:hypothetical protein